jgi:biopolymer transport protein ExbD
MARLQRTLRADVRIPVASMADIAFLLIIFYMSTTIFRMENGLPVTLPGAESAQRLKNEHLAHVWIGAGGEVSIDDRIVPLDGIAPAVSRKLQQDPALTVAVVADGRVPYRVVARALEELQNAGALSITFTSEPEPR